MAATRFSHKVVQQATLGYLLTSIITIWNKQQSLANFFHSRSKRIHFPLISISSTHDLTLTQFLQLYFPQLNFATRSSHLSLSSSLPHSSIRRVSLSSLFLPLFLPSLSHPFNNSVSNSMCRTWLWCLFSPFLRSRHTPASIKTLFSSLPTTVWTGVTRHCIKMAITDQATDLSISWIEQKIIASLFQIVTWIKIVELVINSY